MMTPPVGLCVGVSRFPGFFAFYRIIDTDEVLAEFSYGNAVWLRQTLIKTRDFDLLSVLEHFFQGIRGVMNSSSLAFSSCFISTANWLLRLLRTTMVSNKLPVPCCSNEWLSRVSVVLSALMDLKFVLIR